MRYTKLFLFAALPALALSCNKEAESEQIPAGGIRFTVGQSGIAKIIITGNNNETLAGKVKVQFDGEGHPAVSEVIEGSTSITLNAPTDSGFEAGKWYYFSVLPIIFSKGFSVEFIKRADESECGTRNFVSPVEIKRSVFGSLENIDKGVAFAIDLGLSVNWAVCNIGANSPEQSGRYFAWGDVNGQIWNGSSWSGSGFSSYPVYELDDNGNLKPEYDAAHVNLGGNWRMPTHAELLELINNCTSIWMSINGVNGRLFTSKKEGYTDKSIFLPAAGCGRDSDIDNVGSNGNYWSSTFDGGSLAWYLHFDSDDVDTRSYDRNYGRSVRPVSE